MYCDKCGTTNSEQAKFCKACGSELLNNSFQQQNYNNNPQEKREKENGKISIILGIISLILGPLLCLIAMPLSIVGTVLATKAKDKGTIGLIINVISLLLSLIYIAIFSITIFYVLREMYTKNVYSNTYICGDYYEGITLDKISNNIIFDLKKDNTFIIQYEYPDGSGKIEGSYKTTNIEYNSNNTDSYKYTIELDATSRFIDNEKVEGPYQTEYIIEVNNNNEALIQNTISYSKYLCKKVG